MMILKDLFQKLVLQNNFYKLIEIDTPEHIFKSIVNVATLFYNEYKDTYVLAYHCKSGKDTTSIFDSVVHATFMYLKKIKKVNKKKQNMFLHLVVKCL